MVIDTSLDGVFHLCRAAVFAMMERRCGRIVAVSSVCGEYDHAPRHADTLARPGLAGFVRALASQTRRFGISVNAVTPGPGAPDAAALLPERPPADLAETIALRRFGNAADVASLVASLLSADAPDITGRVTGAGGAAQVEHAVQAGVDDHSPVGLVQPGQRLLPGEPLCKSSR